MITGNEEHDFYWKGFGFKLHVPRNALKSWVSDCTLHVKAFLPNNYLELPVNTKLVSAIYYISMPSPSALTEGVDIEIEHCCNLVEGNQGRLRFVTSKSARWERASFSYIDGGHFHNESTYGRISLHHFSWFAVVWQGIVSLFSVTRYCIKVYLESVSLTTKYIHFILIMNLEVNLKVIMVLTTERNVLYCYSFLYRPLKHNIHGVKRNFLVVKLSLMITVMRSY